jgi:very-short-patch-repair endonuclease
MRPDQVLIELAAKNHGLATTSEVCNAGLSDDQWLRMCQTDVWVPVVPGVWRHAATPLSWEMKVRAGTAWLGREAALHGSTALKWLGIVNTNDSPAEFIVPRSRRHVPAWIGLHTSQEWDRGDFITHNSVRTSTATRAIIDMARTGNARAVEEAIDTAMRMRRTSVPTLTRRMAEMSGSGRSGIVMLRTLMLDSGGESSLERAFLRIVRTSGLPRPRTQVVHRRPGERVIRVDFQFDHASVVVEVSGRLGHTSDRDRQRDARRRNGLQAVGLKVVEFTTADVLHDPAYVIATLHEHLGS